MVALVFSMPDLAEAATLAAVSFIPFIFPPFSFSFAKTKLQNAQTHTVGMGSEDKAGSGELQIGLRRRSGVRRVAKYKN